MELVQWLLEEGGAKADKADDSGMTCLLRAGTNMSFLYRFLVTAQTGCNACVNRLSPLCCLLVAFL
jgi:hypothetical protein